jgi:hypothetical protein
MMHCVQHGALVIYLPINTRRPAYLFKYKLSNLFCRSRIDFRVHIVWCNFIDVSEERTLVIKAELSFSLYPGDAGYKQSHPTGRYSS